MTRTDFTIMLDEVMNEFDCKINGILYTDDNIAIVNYTDGFDTNIQFYVAYRFMNRARLRLLIMEQLNLLIEINPEIDLGF